MSPKGFLVLLMLTVLTVGAAAASLVFRPGEPDHDLAGRVLFDGLRDGLNDVAFVEVDTPETGRLTFERSASGAKKTVWAIAEREGFEARTDVVARTILEVAELTYVAPKTRLKENHARLGVEAPDVAGSGSAMVTLKDASGDVLASLITGTSRSGLEGQTDGGLYARFSGEDQVWLVKGSLRPGREVRDWIDNEGIRLRSADVARAQIRHPDGERIEIFKDQPEDLDFILADVPGTARIAEKGDINAIATTIGRFNVEDVRRADPALFTPDKALSVTYHTFDGGTLALRIIVEKAAKTGGKTRYWMMAEARGLAPWVADINAMARGWAFEITDFRYLALSKRRADLLERAANPQGGG